MGIVVAEDLNRVPVYRFTDPSAFLTCDNPRCETTWLSSDGLVTWPLAGHQPESSRFVDRILVACSADCLRQAKTTQRHVRTWSTPMPVGEWLDALRASLDIDPVTTPIGEFAGDARRIPRPLRVT